MTQINDLQKILAIFLQRKRLELTDSELCSALQTDDDDFSSEKLRRTVQSQCSSLFQIHDNADRTFAVRIEPTVRADLKHLSTPLSR